MMLPEPQKLRHKKIISKYENEKNQFLSYQQEEHQKITQTLVYQYTFFPPFWDMALVCSLSYPGIM